MSRLMTVLLMARTIITFGNSLYVFLDPCKCKSRDVQLCDGKVNNKKKWLVFCADCRARSPWYTWRRTAKRAWNKGTRD